MELDGSLFNDDLFSVDLENIAIPSLPLHFQFPDTDLADEADKSDMGAVGLSVIDPHFVRESNIEDCVIEAVGQVGPVSSGHRLDDCLSSFDVARHYSRLHVLVCGFCHSVFHVIDEFRSHTNCCTGVSEAPIWASTSPAAPGLAIVLWTDTVMRLVRKRLGDAGDHLSLVKRIESKWYRLSRKTKLCWERAAEVLLESARVGRSMFASAMERDISCTPGCPGEQWPGPLDFCDADEIHGTELELEPVKLEAESEYDKDQLPSEQPDPKQEENEETPTTEPLGITDTPDGPPNETDEDLEVLLESVVKKPGKRLGYLNIARNKKGRWEGPKTEVKTFQCTSCDFTTVTEWKLKRHEGSSKHINRLEVSHSVAAEENSTKAKPPGDPGGLFAKALGGFNWDHSYGTVSTVETSATKDEALVQNQQA